VTRAIGIDIGGTFIDIVLADERAMRWLKVPSTPGEPEVGVLAALQSLADSGDIDPTAISRVAHGSTVATNALLEGKWARTALVTTRGFRDVLEIGRQHRKHLYDLMQERAPLLVPRDLRFEITERLNADGSTLTPLAEHEIPELVEQLRAAEVEAIAVVLLFSYLDPTHEQLLGERLAAYIHDHSLCVPPSHHRKVSDRALGWGSIAWHHERLANHAVQWHSDRELKCTG